MPLNLTNFMKHLSFYLHHLFTSDNLPIMQCRFGLRCVYMSVPVNSSLSPFTTYRHRTKHIF